MPARAEGSQTARPSWGKAIWLALLYSPLIALNLLFTVCMRDRRRFLPLEEYPALAGLTANFPVIRGELMQLQQEGLRIPGFAEVDEGQIRLAGDGQWKTLVFRIFGVDVPRNRALCPKTAEFIDRVPGISMAMFSIFEPGKRLPLHSGVYRGVLRYHLPLIAADPEKCGITVGGETRRFEEGVPLLFDDVYPHTAWNLSDQPRVVLFIDLERRMPYRWLTALNRWCLATLSRARRVRRAAERSPARRE